MILGREATSQTQVQPEDFVRTRTRAQVLLDRLVEIKSFLIFNPSNHRSHRKPTRLSSFACSAGPSRATAASDVRGPTEDRDRLCAARGPTCKPYGPSAWGLSTPRALSVKLHKMTIRMWNAAKSRSNHSGARYIYISKQFG